MDVDPRYGLGDYLIALTRETTKAALALSLFPTAGNAFLFISNELYALHEKFA